MPLIRRRAPLRRPIRGSAAGLRRSPEKRAAAAALAALLVIAVLLVTAGSFLKKVSGDMALSDASDLITATINDKINERMRGGLYDYDYFVSLQKDNNGNITAISANMARINTLSSEILRDVISATNSGLHDLHIPLGNLLGMNLLMGRGPRVPVRILMLTSSYADFRNELAAAGINQIKHQIILEVRVEIDVLLPWELRSTEVVSEVLIAETVIVGKVPEAYLSMVSP